MDRRLALHSCLFGALGDCRQRGPCVLDKAANRLQEIPFGSTKMTVAAIPCTCIMPFKAEALVEVTSLRMTAA